MPPLGCEAAPKPFTPVASDKPHSLVLRLLRSRTGRCGDPTSPLATISALTTDFRQPCGSRLSNTRFTANSPSMTTD
ncbi:hypothetical protein EI534_20935 [Pseudomonas frederiksbergensis]|nr:hypothetical protein [Pseudomonas frederiksbergensis]